MSFLREGEGKCSTVFLQIAPWPLADTEIYFEQWPPSSIELGGGGGWQTPPRSRILVRLNYLPAGKQVEGLHFSSLKNIIS